MPVGLVLAAGAAVALGAVTVPLGAVVAGAQCWACWDGFVLHRFGTLDGGRGDLAALGLICGAAVLAAAARAARGYAGRRITGPLPGIGVLIRQ